MYKRHQFRKTNFVELNNHGIFYCKLPELGKDVSIVLEPCSCGFDVFIYDFENKIEITSKICTKHKDYSSLDHPNFVLGLKPNKRTKGTWKQAIKIALDLYKTLNK